MTVFQYVIVIGITLFLVGFGGVIWILYRSLLTPINKAIKEEKIFIETEVEKAKLGLDHYQAETRMDPKETKLETNDLDKLRLIRRK